MRVGSMMIACGLLLQVAADARAQTSQAEDPVATLVGRLDLERYKETIEGLTQFGDRRQGTERNRRAVDWIEQQLQSYGCATERLHYEYDPPPPPPRPANAPTVTAPRREPPSPVIASGEVRLGPGGSRYRGITRPTGVNTDSLQQTDERLRALNSEPATNGPRSQVYCTKVGATRPDEMYIIGAHMDGHGWGQAANDNGSGTALVMELARILNSPDVVTDRSIRFALWNNEETGLNGAYAYVRQRAGLARASRVSKSRMAPGCIPSRSGSA
jgi:acetylornithine deacetylase/succinyl-diaminopimelate desuccinylase-like protein